MDHYFTIGNTAIAEYKDRGSKFIAYADSINDPVQFKKRLKELKKEHPKAAHHCFAYRIGMEGNNFRVSDDGEPPGTAGKPILGQIDKKVLTDTLVVVVRYFGGTLLGVPGLINAYKTATALALQLTPAIQKQIELAYRVQFSYPQIKEVMMVIKHFNCTISKQDMQLFCVVEIGLPKKHLAEVLRSFHEISGVEVSIIT